MDSRYNYENRPTNAQMKTQYNIQYSLNHAYATIKAAWNSLSFLQKIVLIGIIAFIIYFIVKLIKQQRKWASIRRSQTEPLFLSDLKWDSSGKKIYIGNKPLDVIPGSKLPKSSTNSYTYSFWIFMNGHNPFYPGADGAKGPANISDKSYNGIMNNLFYRGSGEYQPDGSSPQTPGVWFGGASNDQLQISLTTIMGNTQKVIIDDVAVNEWINVTLTVNDRVVNIFINGKLERSVLLNSAAKVPGTGFGLYVGRVAKGFPGEMAYLQYYNSALESRKIQEIYAYYKRKIDEFMANVNYWLINNKVVPAVPTNLECIPVDDGNDDDNSDDTTTSFMGKFNALKSKMKTEINSGGSEGSSMLKEYKSELNKFKTGIDANGNGSGSNGVGNEVMGKMKGVQGNVSNMKAKFGNIENSASKKMDQWENGFSNFHF